MEKDIFKIIEKRKSSDILIALYPNKEFSGTDLRELAKANSTIFQVRLSDLIKENLISEKRDRHLNNRRYISLTEKGKVIAKILIELKDALLLEEPT